MMWDAVERTSSLFSQGLNSRPFSQPNPIRSTFRARKPRGHSAASQPLNVDRDVGREPAHLPPNLPHGTQRLQPVTRHGDEPIQGGMSFEQTTRSPFNDPREFGPRQMVAQGTQNGQTMEHVANGR